MIDRMGKASALPIQMGFNSVLQVITSGVMSHWLRLTSKRGERVEISPTGFDPSLTQWINGINRYNRSGERLQLREESDRSPRIRRNKCRGDIGG